MNRPKVGVTAIVRRDGMVLMGKRKSAHASGCYGFPGGHLEGGESFETCACRETAEEAGLMLPLVRFWRVENVIFYPEDRHYVTVFMVGDLPAGQQPKVMEPKKCASWEWFEWDKMPAKIMHGIEMLHAKNLNPMNF